MSAPKKGDRVHVDFEGIVTHVPRVPVDAPELVMMAHGAILCCVPLSACDVIVPPIALGDTVTAENVQQLGFGSIVAHPGRYPSLKQGDSTWLSSDPSDVQNGYTYGSLHSAVIGAVVLRIGGGETA